MVDDSLAGVVASGMLRATTHFEEVAALDFVAICVPTPLTNTNSRTFLYVEKSTRDVAIHLKRGHRRRVGVHDVSRTTEELMLPILEEVSVCVAERIFTGFFTGEGGSGQPAIQERIRRRSSASVDSTEVQRLFTNCFDGEGSPRVQSQGGGGWRRFSKTLIAM